MSKEAKPIAGVVKAGQVLKNISTYNNIHTKLRSLYGKASKCEFENCKSKKPKRFEWALKRGREYSLRRQDYLQLCPSCHRKYDETDERREKISASLSGRKLSNTHRAKLLIVNKEKSKKPVLQLDLSGNFICEWPSVNEAAAGVGAIPSSISQCLTGKYKKAAGFRWRYKTKSLNK